MNQVNFVEVHLVMSIYGVFQYKIERKKRGKEVERERKRERVMRTQRIEIPITGKFVSCNFSIDQLDLNFFDGDDS